MEDKKYEELNNKLYASSYGLTKKYNPNEIWNEIKNNQNALKWAIKPKKDRFDGKELVNGLSIAENILIDYKNVNKDIYNELIDKIYSNKDLARVYTEGSYYGAFTFLIMTLWNPNLELTEEQKEFVVSEAIDKTKSNNLLMVGGYNVRSDSQCHGFGEFDIRYWILRNHNWSIEEKKDLINKFYEDDEIFEETLNKWEWDIVNNSANKDLPFNFDIAQIYEDPYDMLYESYTDKEKAKRIIDAIEFCKQMREIRTIDKPKTKIKTTNLM